MSSSFQSSSNSSTSTPEVVPTPENAILNQLSGIAAQYANQMYGWAQGVFAKTSQITDQAVGNFFQVSQKMLGLSNNLTDQYNNLFAPENAQLVADANSYASPARMAVDMGQAGATQAQAGDQALHNSEEALKSYGIDPSSGRYAALDKAAAVQNAANVAGAMNTQRNADIATGQRLRSEAVQVGAQLPSAIANTANTAIAANTGASNAELANANTGANLFQLPNAYMKTAMGIPLSPVGQNSKSQGYSSGMSSSPDKGGSSGGGGGGGSGSAFNPGGGGPAWMPEHTGYQSDNTGYAARGGGLPGAGIMHLTPGQDDRGWPPPPPPPPEERPWETGTGTIGQPTTDPFNDYGGGASQFGSSYGQDWGNGNTFGDTTNPGFTGDFSGGQTGNGGGSDMNGLGAYNYDYGANQFDPNSVTGGWQDPAPQITTDPGVWGDQPSQGDSGSYTDYGNAPGVDWSGTYSPDQSSPDQSSDGEMDWSNFAKGGVVRPVHNFKPGGPVRRQMSPSQGQRVDDVKAKVNVGEFVVPRDVVAFKGHQFFENLIRQARKNNVMRSAQQAR